MSKHQTLGELIAHLRQQAGFENQIDLAKRLGVAQQTVSRWELGTSRPTAKQMPQIAALLKVEVGVLLAASTPATPIATVASFDQPFPLEALTAEQFERFCFDVCTLLYPQATVHRAGGQGHKQDGLDITVDFLDGARYSFQCKRHNEFGKAKIKAAVDAHIASANKKFILLSRIASPGARQEITQYQDWEIWDRDDIAQKIRHYISKDEQRRLVDIFFKGQRMALLGETESGPWQTTNEFFASMLTLQTGFSHAWECIGRENELQAIINNLQDTRRVLHFLIGAGGSGKSRLLKQIADQFESMRSDVVLRFLATNEQASSKSLEDLGKREKLLIIDDAHDRQDLPLLFQYAANPANDAHLLLALRPYSLEMLKMQAGRFALMGERISEHPLAKLTLPQHAALARQVLQAFGGPTEVADDIAQLTGDSPLATVLCAELVAKEKIHPQLTPNSADFKRELFSRFSQVITGEIAKGEDAELLKRLQNLLALLQPFDIENDALAQLALTVEKIAPHDTKRLLKLLAATGIIRKRGSEYRFTPDLLADLIIERACVGLGNTSTGYAELVFDAANGWQLENLLLNLAKLDWRLANGDTSQSKLLNNIWHKLQVNAETTDDQLYAITHLAYYQPERALDFAENLISAKNYRFELPELLHNIAYNLPYLPRVCECLWALCKATGQNFPTVAQNAFEVLTRLCSVEQGKPLAYNEEVVKYMLPLLACDEEWLGRYTPQDVLKPILATHGQESRVIGNQVRFTSFAILPGDIAELRSQVIDEAILLLEHSDSKRAVSVARFLQDALRYPMGLSGNKLEPLVMDGWTLEFEQTLRKIQKVAIKPSLRPLVFIELCETVAWHADYGTDECKEIAASIIASRPTTLEFRAIFAFTHTFQDLCDEEDYEAAQRALDQQCTALATELRTTYPDEAELVIKIETWLEAMSANQVAYKGDALMQQLLASEKFSRAIITHTLNYPDANCQQFAASALAKILAQDRAQGQNLAQSLIDSQNPLSCVLVARAYANFELRALAYNNNDIRTLEALLTCSDATVVPHTIAAIETLAFNNEGLALRLFKMIDVGNNAKRADELLYHFHQNKKFATLAEQDVRHFLEKLKQIAQLDGYRIETFLANASEHFPIETANFFLARLEIAAKNDDWHYRPCNHGPYCHVPLRFHDSRHFSLLVRKVTQWMMKKAGENDRFNYAAAQLYNAMFAPYEAEVVTCLEEWSTRLTPTNLHLFANILYWASVDFVFVQKPFVIRLLSHATRLGNAIQKEIMSALFSSAVSMIKSGPAGEPFPQDVKLKQQAEHAQLELSRFEPAFRLYADLQKHAERNITQSHKRREADDDNAD